MICSALRPRRRGFFQLRQELLESLVRETNFEETLRAIKEKYGEPSGIRSGVVTEIKYGYKNGKVIASPYACANLERMSHLSLVHPDVLGRDLWYERMAETSRADAASAGPNDGCSAVMFITISYPTANDRSNKQVVSKIGFVFFDADRFRAALARDAAARKEQEDKARSNTPKGTGASKL